MHNTTRQYAAAFPTMQLSGNKRVLSAVLALVLLINIVLLRNVLTNEDPNTPIPTVFPNRCTTPLLEAPQYNTNTRLPTLVIYVYSEIDEVKMENLLFFLQHGLCEDCYNVDYAFVLNGETSIDIPKLKNIRVFRRDNVCGDFGAWEFLFKHIGEEAYKKYKRFMFINDTSRGPFIDSKFRFFLPKNLHFTDIYSAQITEETRLVGSYINCGGYSGSPFHAHVQTMSFMMDDVALNLSMPIFQCYTNKTETVLKGEIGLSKNLIEKNINIASLQYAYRGIDFRCNDNLRRTCNSGKNPTLELNYFGIDANPMEVVFYKHSLVTAPFKGTKLLYLYSNWTNQQASPQVLPPEIN